MSRLPRRVAVSAVALSVLAAGASRVALNVHYPSDVLAGWSLGYLYFLLCVMVIRPAGAERSRNRWTRTIWSRRGDLTGSKALLDLGLCGFDD